MLKFIKQFTDKDLGNVIQIANRHYLSKGLEYSETPRHIGVFLGEEIENKFHPSIELIEILSKMSNKKIFINDKSEWIFLNGKDILGKAITKANVTNGLVFVQNKKDENLGYGKFILDIKRKDEVVVKNILDRGHYLRCE